MLYIKTKKLTKKEQDLCGLQGIFFLFNCQTPGQASDLRLVLHESSQTVIDELLAGIQDYISCDKRSACAPAAS